MKILSLVIRIISRYIQPPLCFHLMFEVDYYSMVAHIEHSPVGLQLLCPNDHFF